MVTVAMSEAGRFSGGAQAASASEATARWHAAAAELLTREAECRAWLASATSSDLSHLTLVEASRDGTVLLEALEACGEDVEIAYGGSMLDAVANVEAFKDSSLRLGVAKAAQVEADELAQAPHSVGLTECLRQLALKLSSQGACTTMPTFERGSFKGSQSAVAVSAFQYVRSLPDSTVRALAGEARSDDEARETLDATAADSSASTPPRERDTAAARSDATARAIGDVKLADDAALFRELERALEGFHAAEHAARVAETADLLGRAALGPAKRAALMDDDAAHSSGIRSGARAGSGEESAVGMSTEDMFAEIDASLARCAAVTLNVRELAADALRPDFFGEILRENAAVKIQAAARGYLQRTGSTPSSFGFGSYEEELPFERPNRPDILSEIKSDRAAAKIQQHARGSITRNAYKELRNAATRIRRAWLKHRSRRDALAEKIRAALPIDPSDIQITDVWLVELAELARGGNASGWRRNGETNGVAVDMMLLGNTRAPRYMRGITYINRDADTVWEMIRSPVEYEAWLPQVLQTRVVKELSDASHVCHIALRHDLFTYATDDRDFVTVHSTATLRDGTRVAAMRSIVDSSLPEMRQYTRGEMGMWGFHVTEDRTASYPRSRVVFVAQVDPRGWLPGKAASAYVCGDVPLVLSHLRAAAQEKTALENGEEGVYIADE